MRRRNGCARLSSPMTRPCARKAATSSGICGSGRAHRFSPRARWRPSRSTSARTRRRARRSRTPSTCYLTRQSRTSASSRISGSTPLTPASSAVTCRSRQRTARVPLRRAAASSASMAACRRRTARRPGLQGYALTRTDEHFTLYAIKSFDKDTKTIVTEAREIAPR